MPSPQVKSGETVTLTATPTLTVHAAYVSGDYVGTSGAALTLTNAAREIGGGGLILGALLIDAVVASKAGELWLFDAAPTPPADSAAWTISDADAAKCIGVLTFAAADYKASALNSVCPNSSTDKAIAFKCAADSRNLYACFVTRDTPAYAATGDIKFKLWICQD